ncbi:MAG: hypothetical protein RIS21_707, partial [Planctomycetota bacterium]
RYDPETGAAEVTFFGVPRVDASDAHVDNSRSSSYCLMAGAGFEPATSGL